MREVITTDAAPAAAGPYSQAIRAGELVFPLRDLFAAVFFVFFGLQIDVDALPGAAVVAVALAVVTAMTKIGTGWWAARRWPRTTASSPATGC